MVWSEWQTSGPLLATMRDKDYGAWSSKPSPDPFEAFRIEGLTPPADSQWEGLQRRLAGGWDVQWGTYKSTSPFANNDGRFPAIVLNGASVGGSLGSLYGSYYGAFHVGQGDYQLDVSSVPAWHLDYFYPPEFSALRASGTFVLGRDYGPVPGTDPANAIYTEWEAGSSTVLLSDATRLTLTFTEPFSYFFTDAKVQDYSPFRFRVWAGAEHTFGHTFPLPLGDVIVREYVADGSSYVVVEPAPDNPLPGFLGTRSGVTTFQLSHADLAQYVGGGRVLLTLTPPYIQPFDKLWPPGYMGASVSRSTTSGYGLKMQATVNVPYQFPRWRYWIPLVPPLRQYQREDGLVFANTRAFTRNAPSSIQDGRRAGWSGTYL